MLTIFGGVKKKAVLCSVCTRGRCRPVGMTSRAIDYGTNLSTGRGMEANSPTSPQSTTDYSECQHRNTLNTSKSESSLLRFQIFKIDI